MHPIFICDLVHVEFRNMPPGACTHKSRFSYVFFAFFCIIAGKHQPGGIFLQIQRVFAKSKLPKEAIGEVLRQRRHKLRLW